MVIISNAEYESQVLKLQGHSELQDNRFAVVAGLYIEVIEYLDPELTGVSFVVARKANDVHTASDCDAIDFESDPVAIYQCTNTAEAHKQFIALIETRLLARYR